MQFFTSEKLSDLVVNFILFIQKQIHGCVKNSLKNIISEKLSCEQVLFNSNDLHFGCWSMAEFIETWLPCFI